MTKNTVAVTLILILGLTSCVKADNAKALTRPIDCTDFRVKNVRDCVYTEPDGDPVCNSDHKLCSGTRTKCVYDRVPEYGGGWAFCFKEVTATTCTSQVVAKCVPTPTPLGKLATGPKPTATPKSSSTSGTGLPSPTPGAPGVVTGAKKPAVLPKTGSNTLGIISGLLALSGSGFWIIKRFKQV